MIDRRFVPILTAFLLLAPALLSGQDAAQDFDGFYSKFKTAVSQKDTSSLTRRMSPRFDFFQARNVAHADVFKQLDAEGGKQWANLQDAIKAQPSDFPEGYFGKPARALQCTPTNVAYRCLVIFTQDSQHHWRWKAMIMPKDGQGRHR